MADLLFDLCKTPRPAVGGHIQVFGSTLSLLSDTMVGFAAAVGQRRVQPIGSIDRPLLRRGPSRK